MVRWQVEVQSFCRREYFASGKEYLLPYLCPHRTGYLKRELAFVRFTYEPAETGAGGRRGQEGRGAGGSGRDSNGRLYQKEGTVGVEIRFERRFEARSYRRMFTAKETLSALPLRGFYIQHKGVDARRRDRLAQLHLRVSIH